MKTAMPSAIGVGDEQREDRRIQRAPDERERAELTRDRIPDLVRQKSRPNFSIDSLDWRANSNPIAHDDQR